MNAIRTLLLLGTAVTATWVLREGAPLRQILALNFLGMVLGMLFLAYQAPDVALAEIAVGAAAQPLVYLAVLSRLHRKGNPQATQGAPDREEGA
jgi:energy-converting hydrogenase B subunit D